MNRTATFQELEGLRATCRDTLNWTDGGYWMGDGIEPDCFGKKIIAQSKHKLVIKFVSESGWKNWNNNIDNSRSTSAFILGTIGTAAITISGIPTLAQFITGTFLNGGLLAYTQTEKSPHVSQGWDIEIYETYIITASTFSRSSFSKTVRLKVIPPSRKINYDESTTVDFHINSQLDLNLFYKLTSLRNTVRILLK